MPLASSTRKPAMENKRHVIVGVTLLAAAVSIAAPFFYLKVPGQLMHQWQQALFPHAFAPEPDAWKSRFPAAPNGIEHSAIVIETPGGTDKVAGGHRGDTEPLLAAFRQLGWHAEAVYYTDSNATAVKEYIGRRATLFISRVDPGV